MSKTKKRGGKSIRRQLLDVNHRCYKPGRDKHTAKKERPGEWQDGTIYSRQTKRNRDQTAAQFGLWIHEAFPEVKRAVDISERHLNAYLAFVAQSPGVGGEIPSKATLGRYASELRGIAKGIALVHGRSAADPSEIVAPAVPDPERQRARGVPMARADRERLERSFTPGSTGARALALSRIAGLRVAEAAALTRERIAEDGSCVYVRAGAKGGRSRDVPVPDPAQRAELIRIRQATPEGGMVLRGVKPESVDRTIRRHMQKLDMSETYGKTTYHAMRKLWAQERYDWYRTNGASKYEAIRWVNRDLGHGEERDVDLLAVYVQNIH